MPLFGAGGFKPPASAYSATRANHSHYRSIISLVTLVRQFHEERF